MNAPPTPADPAVSRPSPHAPPLFSIVDLEGPSPDRLGLGPLGDGHLFLGAGLFPHPSDGPDEGGFVADPFFFDVDDRPGLLMEVWDQRRSRGYIAWGVRDDDSRWTDARPVVREDFHLSYPHPVRHPEHPGLFLTESAEAGEVRSYRRTAAGTWEFAGPVLPGPHLDPTPLFLDGVWYLFTCRPGGADDTLDLWVSRDDIFGPWSPHPRSPVVTGDPRRARPAGPVLTWQGRHHRVAQDCSRHYGERVVAAEIITLTPDDYEESPPVPLLTGGDMWWNSRGMHHLDIRTTERGLWAVADGQRAPVRTPGTPAKS